jgi:hypothetical protein
VATGCGIAAIVILIALFGAGYFFTHGGMSTLMTWVFNQTKSDMAGMYTKEVTAAQKKDFENELTTFQHNLDAKRIRSDKLQPILADMRDVMMDAKATPAEMDKLTAGLHAANRLAAESNPPR